MSKKRCLGFVYVYKQFIFVLGGYTGNMKRSKKIERYTESIN